MTLCLRLGVAGSLALIFSQWCAATTYIVHPDGTGDFPTIQAAIDGTEDGDVIELSNGTFSGPGNRDIECDDKTITIRSSSGDPDLCIIDCEGSQSENHRGFLFYGAGDPAPSIEALTVIHAYVWYRGGAVKCDGASPVFIDCIFRDNTVEGSGAGVSCSESNPSFSRCWFVDNTAGAGAGAFVGAQSSPHFDHCVFNRNVATYAGACWLTEGSSPQLTNCVLSENEASSKGTVACDMGAQVVIANCTFERNAVAEPLYASVFDIAYDGQLTLENSIAAFNSGGPAIVCWDSSPITVGCCNVYGNEGGDWVGCIADQLGQDGNISLDPQFCSPTPTDDLNWSIQSDSPCAPFSAPNPECDLIGAWGVGCGSTPAERATWGGIKALYR